MKKIFISVIILSILCIPVAAFAASGVSQKIGIWVNNKEIKTTAGAEATMINNRVYVPASIFRDAGFSVEYKKSKLTMINKNLLYIQNLDVLNAFHYTFINNFERIDHEISNILGNLLLEKDVDTTKLSELVKTVDLDSNSFDNANFTPVGDYSSSFDFASASKSFNVYKEAIDLLKKYIESGEKEQLEEFYAKRETALQYYALFTEEFDQVFKRSSLNAIK